MVFGHSVGQYAAATLAGGIAIEDGLRLVAERGRIMGQLDRECGMMAVLAPIATVTPLLFEEKELDLAADNGVSTVLSGSSAALHHFGERLTEKGVGHRILRTSHAFHSRLLDPCLDEFEAVASQIESRPLEIPMVDSITGKVMPKGAWLDAGYWRRHSRLAVQYALGVKTLHAEGCDLLLDVSPDPSLTRLASAILPSDADVEYIASVDRRRGSDIALAEAAARMFVFGLPLDFTALIGAPPSRAAAMRLPTYPFQRRRHWLEPDLKPAAVGATEDISDAAFARLLRERLGLEPTQVRRLALLTAAMDTDSVEGAEAVQSPPSTQNQSQPGVLPSGAAETLERQVCRHVAAALRTDQSTLPKHEPLAAMGMDSILLLELVATLSGHLQMHFEPAEINLAQVSVDGIVSLVNAKRLGEAKQVRRLASAEVMLRDAHLADDIRPPALGVAISTEPTCIFLTGGGGFLGSALLARLLACTSARIFCLLRTYQGRPTLQRLSAALAEVGGAPAGWEDRVTVIDGDLEKLRFGLDGDRYAELAQRVDVVYHAAAQVNWLASYDELAAVNVHGTHEVLRFACAVRLKPVHVVSTLGVFPGGLPAGSSVALESAIPQPDGDRFESPYAQTKCVSELLCDEARQQGVPVSIYRMDFLTGAANGGITPWRYIVPRAIASAVELGCLPDFPGLIDVLPIDYVAGAIVALAHLPYSRDANFHLLNRQPLRMSAVRDLLAGLGYPVRLVSYPDWLKRIRDVGEGGLYPFVSFLQSVEPILSGYDGFVVDDTQTRAMLVESSPELLDQILSPHNIIARMVDELIQKKRIPPPGWQCTTMVQGNEGCAAAKKEWETFGRTESGFSVVPSEVEGTFIVSVPRPAMSQRGSALGARAEAGHSTNKRVCGHAVLIGESFFALNKLAERFGVAPARVLAAAALVMLWRVRNSPTFEAETLAVATLSSTSPVLALAHGGFVTRNVSLSADMPFSSVVEELAQSASEPQPAYADVYMVLRDTAAGTAPISLGGGPCAPVVDIACGIRDASLDWFDGGRPLFAVDCLGE